MADASEAKVAPHESDAPQTDIPQKVSTEIHEVGGDGPTVAKAERVNTEAGLIVFELAKELDITMLVRKFPQEVANATALAFMAAQNRLSQFVRTLKRLSGKSLELLQAASPTAAQFASKVTSMFGSSYSTVESVTSTVFQFVKATWITRTLALLIVFRYIHNSCAGIDDEEYNDLIDQTESIFSSVIGFVAPWGVASLLKFCIRAMAMAVRVAIAPIRIALGPIVSICKSVSSKVKEEKAYIDLTRKRQLELEDENTLMRMARNKVETADIARREIMNQRKFQLEMERLAREDSERKINQNAVNELRRSEIKTQLKQVRAQERDLDKKARDDLKAANIREEKLGTFQWLGPIPWGVNWGAKTQEALEQMERSKKLVEKNKEAQSWVTSLKKRPQFRRGGKAYYVLSPSIRLFDDRWRTEEFKMIR